MWKTSDTHVATFLVAIGHPLRGLAGPRGRREFVFDASAGADRFAYFDDSRPVAPRKLFAAYRDLKSALHASA